VIVEVVGFALIVTGKFTAAPGQVAAFVSTTDTFPIPAAAQFTVILWVVPPLDCMPPVIVQA
jgi:hypothetical protein